MTDLYDYHNGPNLGLEPTTPMKAGAAPQPAEPVKVPSDADIDAVFNDMPDGANGWLKSWGYRQFARALLARYGRPAGDAQPVAWVAADTLHSPQPRCVSSLAYMSQLDQDRGREYVALYAAPVAAQKADDARDAARYRWLRVRWGRIADTYDGDSNRLVEIREADDRFEGWDVSPESLDAAIDAAIAHEQGD